RIPLPRPYSEKKHPQGCFFFAVEFKEWAGGGILAALMLPFVLVLVEPRVLKGGGLRFSLRFSSSGWAGNYLKAMRADKWHNLVF
ncbi:hypothetical protein, partial [Pseudomonas gingeri]|uniref:hypothetical protein n=1 Tax=Pseudomonas gingeri TaxID=117681 RepID=UPI001C4B0C14